MRSARSRSKRALRLRLYVAGDSPNSVAALRHLRAVLDVRPSLQVDLEVIDVLTHADLAERDHVLVTPTILKLWPLPLRRIVGRLNDNTLLVSALGLSEKQDG
jgi:circadian clock protein KaiB